MFRGWAALQWRGALILGAGLAGMVAHAGAQLRDESLDAARAQREQVERIEQWRRELERRAPVVGDPRGAPWRAPEVGEQPCMYVHEVRIEATEPAAASLVGPVRRLGAFDGACLGARSIEALRANLQDRLVASGHVTSRIELEPQDLRGGILRFVLRPGLLEAVVVEGARTPGTAPAANALAMRPGRVLDLRELEHTLENLNRLPSQAARFVIEPGSVPGASVVRVLPVAAQEPAWRAGVGTESADGRDYGRWQAGVQAAFDSPLGLSDQFGFQAAQASRRVEGERPLQSSWFVHWSVPVARHLITLSMSRAEFTRFISGGVGRFSESGRDDNARARWQWTPWRGGAGRLQLWAAGSERRARTSIDDIELIARRRLATSVEQGAGLWLRGALCQGAVEAEGTQVQRLERDSEFQAPTVGLPRQWRAEMQWACRLGTSGLELSGQSWTQRVAQPVDGSDLIVLGSRQTVRGYAAADARTGRGLTVLRQELALPGWLLGQDAVIRLATGIDWGRIHHPIDGGVRGRELAAATLALRWQAGRFSGELAATRPLGAAPNEQRELRWTGGLRYAI